MAAVENERQVASSGERLAVLLERVGLSAYRFAGYYAGFPLDEPVKQREQSARGHRFRNVKRNLHRWLADDFAIDDEAAVELVTVANRLLLERGEQPVPLDYLVTPEETRAAGLAEIRGLLADVLDRLARIEERLG